MCGRMNVIDNPVMSVVFNLLGIKFVAASNNDLRPTDQVATVANIDGKLQQVNLNWGIKPDWSVKLLINAQSETVADKRTFKKSFKTNRCVVPVSGWYEWRDEGGKRKQQYLFKGKQTDALFMAGIWFSGECTNELVTLTITPNKTCATYHHRMPLLIDQGAIKQWLFGTVDDAQSLIVAPGEEIISVERVGLVR
ncbi:MAG: SOS response-associated peptidase [Spongiibacteraceae bacterium]|nr:SOS response-associated peptidase [Spongiibacteraceae bacterium]